MFLIIILTSLTYQRDIKPIFINRCSSCHNENWKDKNWLDYQTAFKYRIQIKQRVFVLKNMPPIGMKITDEERKIIQKWVDQGAKE